MPTTQSPASKTTTVLDEKDTITSTLALTNMHKWEGNAGRSNCDGADFSTSRTGMLIHNTSSPDDASLPTQGAAMSMAKSTCAVRKVKFEESLNQVFCVEKLTWSDLRGDVRDLTTSCSDPDWCSIGIARANKLCQFAESFILQKAWCMWIAVMDESSTVIVWHESTAQMGDDSRGHARGCLHPAAVALDIDEASRDYDDEGVKRDKERGWDEESRTSINSNVKFRTTSAATLERHGVGGSRESSNGSRCSFHCPRQISDSSQTLAHIPPAQPYYSTSSLDAVPLLPLQANVTDALATRSSNAKKGWMRREGGGRYDDEDEQECQHIDQSKEAGLDEGEETEVGVGERDKEKEEEEVEEEGGEDGYNQKRSAITPKGISRAQFSIDMRDFSDNSYDDDEWSDWDSDCKPEETPCQPNSL
jgi:hypothetical protein